MINPTDQEISKRIQEELRQLQIEDGEDIEHADTQYTDYPQKTCVCDYPNRNSMTKEQWEAAEGHFNQAGGFCCPHHGNTCGHCYRYDR